MNTPATEPILIGPGIAEGITRAFGLTDWSSLSPLPQFVRLLSDPSRQALTDALHAHDTDRRMQAIASTVFERLQTRHGLNPADVAGVLLLSGVCGYFVSETSSSRVLFRDGRPSLEVCFGEDVADDLDTTFGRCDDAAAVALVQGHGYYFTPEGVWDAEQWVEARTAVRRTPFDQAAP